MDQSIIEFSVSAIRMSSATKHAATAAETTRRYDARFCSGLRPASNVISTMDAAAVRSTSGKCGSMAISACANRLIN